MSGPARLRCDFPGCRERAEGAERYARIDGREIVVSWCDGHRADVLQLLVVIDGWVRQHTLTRIPGGGPGLLRAD